MLLQPPLSMPLQAVCVFCCSASFAFARLAVARRSCALFILHAVGELVVLGLYSRFIVFLTVTLRGLS
jgi:hypothetical protein